MLFIILKLRVSEQVPNTVQYHWCNRTTKRSPTKRRRSFWTSQKDFWRWFSLALLQPCTLCGEFLKIETHIWHLLLLKRNSCQIVREKARFLVQRRILWSVERNQQNCGAVTTMVFRECVWPRLTFLEPAMKLKSLWWARTSLEDIWKVVIEAMRSWLSPGKGTLLLPE